MGIAALLLTLSAGAVRVFFLNQSLRGATDEVVTQLREQQEDSVAQAFPLIFGVGFSADADDFTLYSFDPGDDASSTGDDTCSAQSRPLDAGMFSVGARVASTSITNNPVADEYVACSVLPDANDDIIFFYGRGTSTGGSLVLEQPGIDRETTISVSTATGRVTTS
jgi:hypothetical protein